MSCFDCQGPRQLSRRSARDSRLTEAIYRRIGVLALVDWRESLGRSIHKQPQESSLCSHDLPRSVQVLFSATVVKTACLSMSDPLGRRLHSCTNQYATGQRLR